jgi:hypothetical protein
VGRFLPSEEGSLAGLLASRRQLPRRRGEGPWWQFDVGCTVHEIAVIPEIK